MQEDTVLAQEKSASADEETIDPIKEGLAILGIDRKNIVYIGKIFKEIFKQNGSSRNGLSMLNGALYALGSKTNDPEWREHCAGSLRELIHECRGPGQISAWFCKTFKDKNVDFPNSTTGFDDYAQIDGFYNYFSEIHHHNSLYIIQRLQFLYGDHIKVGDDSQEMFIRAVKDFIKKLHSFFKKHIKSA